jgi:hypothetical protein
LLALERRMNAIMRMDLSSEGGYFCFSNHAWRAPLKLAHEHGWEPAGTKPPEFTMYAPDGVTVDELRTLAERQRYAHWDGGYFTNNYLVVSDEDAANIADTLECALDDVPDEGGGRHLLTLAHYQAYQRGELTREELDKAIEQFIECRAASPPRISPQTPAWYFAGEKDYLREFITFCRAGGFSIG